MWASVVLTLCCVLLFGCAADPPNEAPPSPAPSVGNGPLVIDVRTAQEYNTGHIDGATNIPYEMIGDQIAALTEDKERSIVLYCHSGRRSGIAQKTLQDMGYLQVENAGGIAAYRKKLRP